MDEGAPHIKSLSDFNLIAPYVSWSDSEILNPMVPQKNADAAGQIDDEMKIETGVEEVAEINPNFPPKGKLLLVLVIHWD